MVNKEFDVLMQETGALKIKTNETPFALYQSSRPGVFFHYIDFETYRAVKPRAGFLADLFSTFKSENLKIITIWEDLWHARQDLVRARVLSIIGQRQRVHARQTKVLRLDKALASAFLLENHLQGPTSAYYKFGLMWKDELVAVATFSKARTMYDGPVYYRSYELERFASRKGITVTGGLGKLLSHFITETHAAHIMTYADADWGWGEGYLKLGFKLTGKSEPHHFVIDEQGQRHAAQHAPWNQRAQKEKGLLTIAGTGSLKFVLEPQKA